MPEPIPQEPRVEHFFKADPILTDKPVRSITIMIDEPVKEGLEAIRKTGEDILQLSDTAFWEQARRLANCLYQSLPQGLRYRLVVEMMKIEARNYGFFGIDIVPHDSQLLNWLESKRQTVELRYDEV